jgi:hypothetical protein
MLSHCNESCRCGRGLLYGFWISICSSCILFKLLFANISPTQIVCHIVIITGLNEQSVALCDSLQWDRVISYLYNTTSFCYHLAISALSKTKTKYTITQSISLSGEIRIMGKQSSCQEGDVRGGLSGWMHKWLVRVRVFARVSLN